MKLKPGEVVCNRCNGSGKYPSSNNSSTCIDSYKCFKCHGTGKLDWIENIVGKKFSKPILNEWFSVSNANPTKAKFGQIYLNLDNNIISRFNGISWIKIVSS